MPALISALKTAYAARCGINQTARHAGINFSVLDLFKRVVTLSTEIRTSSFSVTRRTEIFKP